LDVEHRGAVNVNAALDWLDAQLDEHVDIERLVVVGISSGSISAAFWVQRLFERYHPGQITVIGDSTPAVISDDCAGILLYAEVVNVVGGCSFLPTRRLKNKCLAKESFSGLDVISVVVPTLGKNAIWLDVAAKIDGVNQLLLSEISVATLEVTDRPAKCEGVSFTFDDQEFYEIVSTYYTALTEAVPNHLVYLLNDTTHHAVDYFAFDTILNDTAVEVVNPFAGGASALAFEEVSTSVISPPFTFEANAASIDASICYYGPLLYEWIEAAENDRVGCNQCAGSVVGNVVGVRDTCDADLLQKCYEGVIFCDTDADCPTGSTCGGNEGGDEDEDEDEDEHGALFCV